MLFRKKRKKNYLLFQYKNCTRGLKQRTKVLFCIMHNLKVKSIARECYKRQNITKFKK